MKCDLCNKPAVVHELVLKNGQKREVHLCEEHAAESGIAMPGQQPLNQLLTQFVVAQSPEESTGKAAKPKATSRRACKGCGLTLTQFRQAGILGCASCYDTFSEQLGALIQRAQGGATHHVGKTPRRAGKCIDRQLQRQRLIKQLDEAVDAEQYERAAKIRDMLNSMAVEAAESEHQQSTDDPRRA